jgi:UDP-N-acetylmuramate dehydrogenase
MPARMQTQVSLRPYNTFGIDVPARWWMEVESERDALEFIMDNAHRSQPILVLGGGSNLLFTGPVEGIVLKAGIRGIAVLESDAGTALVEAGAGESWHGLVEWAIAAGLGGIENLSLIPGTVGAAPIQNIGAYGAELQEVFDSLDAMHLETGAVHRFDRAACRFGYRESIFKQELKGKYLILRVRLRLSRTPVLNTRYGDIAQELAAIGGEPDLRKVSEAVCRIRRSKLPDPAETGNAGSFFKNPSIPAEQAEALQAQHPQMPAYPQADGSVKVPAGWLIEACGWKGRREGACGVHARQALVLVNYGGATGAEILALSARIQADVQARFGIALEREVNVI